MTRTDTPIDRRRARGKAREDFVWHLGTYIIMMTFFSAIALMSHSSFTWVFWIAIPWGLGLAFHALAFVVSGTRLVHREDEYEAVEREAHHV